MTSTVDKMITLERPPVTERAVLVRLVLPGDAEDDVLESLAEMEQLAWTAGADVVAQFMQKRAKPSPGSLIGKGFAEKVHAACEELEADLVIFDSELSPAQGAKLQHILDRKVVDRTQLILDIFAMRAKSLEGKHQVELAQLQYRLPRLTGSNSAMMRQQGGIGVRGPGEQKLEVDRRVIRQRIARLKEELDSVRLSRQVQRRRRQDSSTATVALVGYTNAGKSSLLNALTGEHVLVENKLFATLDPTSRRCPLPSGREVVFTDTVGFIRKLPHGLVAAFRATLEEVSEADLILIVADASQPAIQEQLAAVHNVLKEIKADDKPAVNVYNKTDMAEPGFVQQLLATTPGAVAVSALTGDGLDRLLARTDEILGKGRFTRMTLRIPQRQAGLVARIHESGRVLSKTYDSDEIVVDAEVDAILESQLSEYRVMPV